MRGKTCTIKFSGFNVAPDWLKKWCKVFCQCTARWPEAKVITKCFPIYYNPPLFWLIQKWIFFAGFGNIVPKTLQGRLFCVLYALIGLPGTCLTLKSTGDKITDLFINLITNFEKRVLERSHLMTQKVELKVALTTTVVTVVCLLPLMALLVYLRH